MAAACASVERLGLAEQIGLCHASVGYLRLCAHADALSEGVEPIPAGCIAEAQQRASFRPQAVTTLLQLLAGEHGCALRLQAAVWGRPTFPEIFSEIFHGGE